MSTESVELVIVPELESAKELATLIPASQLTLKQAFAPHFIAFLALEDKAKAVSVNAPKAARETRLELRKIRVASDKSRKAAKEEALNYGKAVDGLHKLLEGRITPLEDRLDQIERAEEIVLQEKAAKLKATRLAELTPLAAVTNTSLDFYDLSGMPELQYRQLLNSTRDAAEAHIAKAKKVEEDRVAAEQARLKREADLAAENARLAKEAEAARKAKVAADQAALQERQKADAEKARLQKEADARLAAQAKAAADEAARLKKVADDKLAKERAERDAADKVAKEKAAQERIESEAKAKRERDAAQAEADKRQKALEAKLAQEREAAAKVAQQLAAKQAAEDAKVAAQAEALHRAATASDREKLSALSTAIRTLKVPPLTNQTLHVKILDQFARMAKWIDTEGNKL